MCGAADRADLYVGEPGPRYRLGHLLWKARAAAPERVPEPRERRPEVVAWDTDCRCQSAAAGRGLHGPDIILK